MDLIDVFKFSRVSIKNKPEKGDTIISKYNNKEFVFIKFLEGCAVSDRSPVMHVLVQSTPDRTVIGRYDEFIFEPEIVAPS